MENSCFDFIEYCQSRGFVRKLNGDLCRVINENRAVMIKFFGERYVVPVTPDFFFAKPVPVSKEQADCEFAYLCRIIDIEFPVLGN